MQNRAIWVIVHDDMHLFAPLPYLLDVDYVGVVYSHYVGYFLLVDICLLHSFDSRFMQSLTVSRKTNCWTQGLLMMIMVIDISNDREIIELAIHLIVFHHTELDTLLLLVFQSILYWWQPNFAPFPTSQSLRWLVSFVELLGLQQRKLRVILIEHHGRLVSIIYIHIYVFHLANAL